VLGELTPIPANVVGIPAISAVSRTFASAIWARHLGTPAQVGLDADHARRSDQPAGPGRFLSRGAHLATRPVPTSSGDVARRIEECQDSARFATTA
jgi:hypothetical protein